MQESECRECHLHLVADSPEDLIQAEFLHYEASWVPQSGVQAYRSYNSGMHVCRTFLVKDRSAEVRHIFTTIEKKVWLREYVPEMKLELENYIFADEPER